MLNIVVQYFKPCRHGGLLLMLCTKYRGQLQCFQPNCCYKPKIPLLQSAHIYIQMSLCGRHYVSLHDEHGVAESFQLNIPAVVHYFFFFREL